MNVEYRKVSKISIYSVYSEKEAKIKLDKIRQKLVVQIMLAAAVKPRKSFLSNMESIILHNFVTNQALIRLRCAHHALQKLQPF